MPLLRPNERRSIKILHFLKVEEIERQYYMVNHFHPTKRLTIYLDKAAIRNIMNCDAKKATEVLKKVAKKEGKPFSRRIRTSAFCEHMNVDELLLQVFLAFLDTSEDSLPLFKRLPLLTPDEMAVQPRRTVAELALQLRAGIMDHTDTLAIRARLWDEKNPWGDPYAKAKKIIPMVIRASEVAQIYGIHIDTARAMLREVREKEELEHPGSKVRRSVSIRKFCATFHEDIEDFRKHLAELHGDDEDDD